MLANLEEKYTHRKLNCFLGVVGDILEENDLVDKATKDIFALL